MFNNFFNKRRSQKFVSKIVMRSNVIQFDEMGSPLRLVMIDQEDGTVDHVWRDIDGTEVKKSDVVLKWEEMPLTTEIQKLRKEENQMEQIFILEDFNGVDGGTLTLHTDGENNLLMITDEKTDEHTSVYITKEHLKEMIDLLN